MRPRFLIQVVSAVVIVLAGVVWLKSRATAIELQTRLTTLTADRDAARRAVQQRDELRTKLAEARRIEAVKATPVAPLPRPPAAARGPITLGEWRTAKEWRNEGQSSARVAVGTLLWAASGGDTVAMASLLALDDEARNKAQELFDALPPAARQSFGTPKAFVASLMTVSVPNEAAQLSWFRQRDDDHATVGLLLRGANPVAPPPTAAVPGDKEPPRLSGAFRGNKFTSLLLERSPAGWQVVMPAIAIERLAHGSVRTAPRP